MFGSTWLHFHNGASMQPKRISLNPNDARVTVWITILMHGSRSVLFTSYSEIDTHLYACSKMHNHSSILISGVKQWRSITFLCLSYTLYQTKWACGTKREKILKRDLKKIVVISTLWSSAAGKINGVQSIHMVELICLTEFLGSTARSFKSLL